ncbi:hypothetical protein CAL13_07200 [Bordetella genomosp. 9]|uniref:YetF C-terminal domain-containing protein n=2 Tax=Bordetella genomosp. 9 TaxID=1416803 RepID=A0A1W6YY32_9BORD|nr:YetF domain-containing protein [Bordetella genomosp. 9]ARP86015.1 hypothetical protein CAL13_07200 [Bordetella genomosp. 9]ARP90036.1 hypothetical protein CAL14_06800 [Bordetella genomosp. 9]
MDIQWENIFTFSMSPIEIIIRGTITYWFIFILMRLAGRRDVGSLGMADVLVVVLISDAAQNAMAGEYKAVPDGMVLIATIVFWSVFIDRLAYAFPRVRPLLQPPKLCIVKDGELQRRAMRRESITPDELESELRQKGITDVADVRRAYIEPDGSISVIKRPGA